MPPDKFRPNKKQERFFQDNILGEKATILTLKVVGYDNRGFAVNIRGPFRLAEYNFPNHSETVIDAEWAGGQESTSHMHCCWTEVRFATLSRTNSTVQETIGYKWKVTFFKSRRDAEGNDDALFWFYIEAENHKALRALRPGKVVAVA
jgi:hypothetical protein